MGDDYLSFEDAETLCVSMGTHLVSIHSDDENAVAVSECSDCWIGLSAVDDYGDEFEWTDGSDWDYTNWNEIQSSNFTKRDCVQMSSSGIWNRTLCSEENRPLCHYGM